MEPYNPELCLKCKGRLWCGLSYCPLLAKRNSLVKVKDKIKNLKEDFSTRTNSVFVGRLNYPHINLGLLSPIESDHPEIYDNPKLWKEENKGINEIINFRTSMINSRKKQNQVKVGNNYYIQSVQEVVLAKRPASVEVTLKEKPKVKVNFSTFTAPFGPNAKLKKMRLEENVSIKRPVEKFYYDTDAKAMTAITELYKRGVDENFLSKAISVGSFGVKSNRKIVPTRWSITAVDDAIGKLLMDKVRDYPQSDVKAYFGGYLGNYYLVLMFDDKWSFELFEMYMPKTDWNISNEIKYTTDYEGFYGRKTYAENCIGGYYAARLSLLERLNHNKKQASVILIRIITPDYYAPLGVWVVREAVRNALSNKPIEFSDKKLMIGYARALLKKKFNINLDLILSNSKLWKELEEQKKLKDFY